jgi:hypothetical protein
MPARKLISAALLTRDAVAARLAIIFGAKMRLDDCGAVRLTGAHGQISSEEETVRRGRR